MTKAAQHNAAFDAFGKLAAKNKKAAAGLMLAAALIIPAEDIVNTVYIDAVGIPTWCFGQTGPNVPPKDKVFTDGECVGLLYAEVVKKRAEMYSCVSVPLNPGEEAAFTSLVYNVGRNAFCNAKKLNSTINSGNTQGACALLAEWVYARVAGVKVKLRGLVNRRAKEMAVCMGNA